MLLDIAEIIIGQPFIQIDEDRTIDITKETVLPQETALTDDHGIDPFVSAIGAGIHIANAAIESSFFSYLESGDLNLLSIQKIPGIISLNYTVPIILDQDAPDLILEILIFVHGSHFIGETVLLIQTLY